MEESLISVCNIKKHFTHSNNYMKSLLGLAVKVTALDDVSLTVNRGEIFALTGPDRAGKTTLLNIMATLWKPDSGKISIMGYDSDTQYKNIRKNIGYLPEKFSLYDELTVDQNIQFYSSLYGINSKENQDFIDDVYQKLEPFKNRKAGQLSGGMRQKLSLCCALIHRPKVLLLDEPTTGIDTASRTEIWNMLVNLKQYGITLVVATSYYHELKYCDRIAFIDHGRLQRTETSYQISHRQQPSWNAQKPDSLLSDDAYCIETTGLTKRFGNFTAVDHINLQVKRGEVFGFLGANGAGKTTTIQILCGLMKSTEGHAIVAGCDINKQLHQLKKRIGYMSQTFHLFQDLDVAENIRLFAGLYGMKDKLIAEKMKSILEQLDLTSQEHMLIHDLPSGDRQKLAFAIAIFHDPELVFLDEPTSGTSEETRHQIWEMIHQSSMRGITIFVTTHYIEEAMNCHRVSLMVNGEIKTIGAPSELMQQYHCNTLEEVFNITSNS